MWLLTLGVGLGRFQYGVFSGGGGDGDDAAHFSAHLHGDLDGFFDEQAFVVFGPRLVGQRIAMAQPFPEFFAQVRREGGEEQHELLHHGAVD